MGGTQNATTNVRGEVEGKIHVEINPNAENTTESKEGNSLVTTYNGRAVEMFQVLRLFCHHKEVSILRVEDIN